MYKLNEEQRQIIREIKDKLNYKSLSHVASNDFDFEKPFNVYKVDLNKKINIALLRKLSGDENVSKYKYNIAITAIRKTCNYIAYNNFYLDSNNRIRNNCYDNYMLKNDNENITFYIFMQSKTYDRHEARSIKYKKNKQQENIYYSDRYLIKNNQIFNRDTGVRYMYWSLDELDKSGYAKATYERIHSLNLERMRKKAKVNDFYKTTEQAKIDAFYNKIKEMYNTYKIKFIGLLMDDKNNIYNIREGLYYLDEIKSRMTSFKNAMNNKTLNAGYMNEEALKDKARYIDLKIKEIESRN